MTTAHPLDRPVWNALKTGWSALAQGDERALRLDPDYGPFGASANTDGDALAALVPTARQLWTIEASEMPVPSGTRVVKTASLHQMVAAHIAPSSAPTFKVVTLTEADAPDMLALALLTKPGPFGALTHRLSAFIGVRHKGRVIAMAGERMRIDGFAEVSGVCTHPDHRGRGYAATLMALVAERIRTRGELPFLHSYSTNTAAIGLYEQLGYVLRRPVTVTVLERDD